MRMRSPIPFGCVLPKLPLLAKAARSGAPQFDFPLAAPPAYGMRRVLNPLGQPRAAVAT